MTLYILVSDGMEWEDIEVYPTIEVAHSRLKQIQSYSANWNYNFRIEILEHHQSSDQVKYEAYCPVYRGLQLTNDGTIKDYNLGLDLMAVKHDDLEQNKTKESSSLL